MTSQIEKFFSEIETLIELQLVNETQAQDINIRRKFGEGKALIDKLEEEDDERYTCYKYRYHSTYASYLTAIKKVDEAFKHEKLLEKYKDFKPEEINVDGNESELFTDIESVNQSSDSDKKSLEEIVQEKLKKALGILGEKVIKPIEENFGQLNKIPKTFDDYQKLVSYENSLLKKLDVLINEELIILDKLNDNLNKLNIEQEMEKVNHRLMTLGDLKELACQYANQAVYSRRLDFIHDTLNSPDKKAILFSNIMFTEEGINKRYRELALCFHPDKTKYSNTPNRLYDNDKYLGAEIFRIALEIKKSLLTDLESASKSKGILDFHEKKANEHWKIAIDYRNAHKGNYNKLKLLNKREIEGIPHDELRRLSIANGLLAYEEYRAACKVADRTKELKKQIKLRDNMALCLYISDRFLEAQLYALSAIRLIYQHYDHISQEDLNETLNEAKQIFDKVRGEASQLNTDAKLKDDLNSSLALVSIPNRRVPFLERITIRKSIDEDIAKLSAELMFKPNRQIVSYQAPMENILHTKKLHYMHTTIVGGTMMVLAAPVALIAGVVCTVLAPLSLGLWSSLVLWPIHILTKGANNFQEPEIREKLNKIISDAIEAYDKGDYQKFIELLSKEYKKDTSILRLNDRDDVIDPKNIINSLLSHGFRSDGIAYLLNLIGEVLCGGKMEISNKIQEDLNSMGKTAFAGVLNENLIKEAKELDDRVRALKEKSLRGFANKFINKIMDFLFLKTHNKLAEEYIKNADEQSFRSRLEEMRNIARINIAILVPMRKRSQGSFCNDQFVSSTELRLEVLEDFLWIIGVYSIKSTNQLNEDQLAEHDGKYFAYLNEKLQKASTNKEKVFLYDKLADYFVKFAERDDTVNRMDSLYHWQDALKNYENIRKIDPNNLDATLGFAKCLLNLSQYDRVIKLSRANSWLTSSAEYWYFCSVAYCKKLEYEDAFGCIIKALELDPQNPLATKQKELLDRLKNEHTIKKRISCYNRKMYDIDDSKNSYKHLNDNSVYRILSIDGGGVRGVLPALWLSELEYRAHRPISQLFNMVTGTSTGGIIAAGLSMPRFEFPPLSTIDLLEFYQNQVKSIFTLNNKWNISSKSATKYTDDGRFSMLSKYFGKTMLNQASTELIIPAVNVNNLRSHLFTRYDSLNNNSKNDTFVNILMATTAAPTFFPSYEIKDKGVFIDGGVQLNNPALEAYAIARKNNAKYEKITVLSLGTGSHMPDPLNSDLYQDILFWKHNIYNIASSAQECSIDRKMHSMLGNNYQRWQISLNKPIAFDDYDSISNLLELGYQYIEELDASDENAINKLVESFESS
ncbi:1389_t:CDS:2 [Racocetra fulgida]|uniref:1389_t:CDS:1 n=1 Tax=Racocetra fulgida TaxID=60492 RepID=A0A9N8ZG41_9GLOM|nr:1389_t:CDS:2 [Racocetra fulgida]